MPTSLLALTPFDRQIVKWIRSAFLMGPTELVPSSTNNAVWMALLERAKLQGLSPLLYAALEAHNFSNVPTFVVDTLEEIYRNSALAVAVMHWETELLLSQFAAYHLEVLVLKGAALSKWLYPQPGLRPFGDLDLLVHPQDRSIVNALMATCGYTESNITSNSFRDTFACETLFNQVSPPHLAVDVHWQILNKLYYQLRIDTHWLWSHTQSFDFGSTDMRTFDPTAQLVYLTLHLALHHARAPRLIHYYDLALLIQKYGAAIDWHSVPSYVQSSGLGRPVYQILKQLQAVWMIAPPENTLELFRPRIFDLREYVAFRFTTATHNEAFVLTDALSVPGIRGKLRYALRHLFPDAAYMRQRYALAPNAFLPYYYARRLVMSGWKFLRSVWSAFLQ